MENNSLRSSRASQPHAAVSLRQRRSGYEPSDAETDWKESPDHDQNHEHETFVPMTSKIDLDWQRKASPLRHSRRHSSKFGDSSPQKDDTSPKMDLGLQRKISPMRYSRRHSSKFSDSSPPKDAPSPKIELDLQRKISPMRNSRRHPSKFTDTSPTKDTTPEPIARRHSSKLLYKAQRDDGSVLSPLPDGINVTPLKSEFGRQVSPHKFTIEEHLCDNNEVAVSNRRKNQRTPTRDERRTHVQIGEDNRENERSTLNHRSTSASRPRARDKDQENGYDHREQKGEKISSPLSNYMTHKPRERQASHPKTPSADELKEMVANIKLSRAPVAAAVNFESTDSIGPGDIFFSRDHTASSAQKNNGMPKNISNGTIPYPRPSGFSQLNPPPYQRSTSTGNIDPPPYQRSTSTGNIDPPPYQRSTSTGNIDPPTYQRSTSNGNIERSPQRIFTSTSASRTTLNSSSAISRQMSSKLSSENSKLSDSSGSLKKFTANRRKSQGDAWFSCMRRGPCKAARSPERKQFDETSFIERAFVVERLRQFWADKHQPSSLDGFTCHRQEAHFLRQLVSHDNIPHILFKGPSGSGKRTLAMALLSEIFGDASRKISHEIRHFSVQDKMANQVRVPIAASVHHMELNVNSEPNAKYALMGLVKEISNNYAMIPEVSNVHFKPDYKVLVLYQVDKAPDNIQHLIKWIMDCYTDACKLILCCEDEVDILESVRNRCKIVKVDAPVTHETMEVLIQIARKEDIELPMSFAAKIAAKSKQNLRKAIMTLEACKAHNYPFADDQPIPFGWEEVLIELAAEILADPSPRRLFFVRGKFQKLLVDFVHPKLILLKLVEQFLKQVEANCRREVYYWHAYYDKRLPTGTTALLKLEEFVAKFMSIHRRSFGSHQFV